LLHQNRLLSYGFYFYRFLFYSFGGTQIPGPLAADFLPSGTRLLPRKAISGGAFLKGFTSCTQLGEDFVEPSQIIDV
jgi:hypothetical protein